MKVYIIYTLLRLFQKVADGMFVWTKCHETAILGCTKNVDWLLYDSH